MNAGAWQEINSCHYRLFLMDMFTCKAIPCPSFQLRSVVLCFIRIIQHWFVQASQIARSTSFALLEQSNHCINHGKIVPWLLHLPIWIGELSYLYLWHSLHLVKSSASFLKLCQPNYKFVLMSHIAYTWRSDDTTRLCIDIFRLNSDKFIVCDKVCTK